MKITQAKTLLILAVWLLGSINVTGLSQETVKYKVSGTVVDDTDHRPLSEIEILVSTKGQSVFKGKTDKDGKFSFEGSFGRHTILIRGGGYKTRIARTDISSKDIDLGEIGLYKADSNANDNTSDYTFAIRSGNSEKKKDTPEELTAAKIEAAPVYSRRGTRVTYDVSRDPDAGKIKMSEMLSRIPDLKVAASNGKLQYEGRPLGKILINNAESGLINKSRQYPMEFIQADYMRNVEIVLPGDLEYNNTEPILIINLARSLPYGLASNLTAKSTTKNAHSPSADLVANTPLIGIGLNYSYNYTGEPSLINNNERQMTDPSADFVSILSTSTNEKESSSHNFTTNFFRNFSGDNIRFNASLSTSGGNSESFSSTRVVSTKSDNTSTESLTERTSVSKEPFRLNGGLRVSGSFGEPTGIKGKRKNEWKLEYSYRNTRSESEDIYSSYTQISSYGMEEHKATGSLNLSRFINKPVHTASMALNGGMYSRQYNTLSDSPLLSSGMDYRQNVGFANLTLLGSVLDNKLGYTLMLNNEYLSNAGNFTNDAVKSPLDYRTFNINPNAGISWRFNRGQIAVTYARLVKRPTVSQLNPYEDRSNPFLVRKGNPNLKGEATDNITLNFTRNPNIRQIMNINLGLTYSATHDKISRVTTLDSDGRAISSFFNMGNSRAIGAKVSSTINLSKNLSTNLIASYQKITVTLPSGMTNSYDSPLFDVVSTWHPKWFELTGSLIVKPSVNSVQSAKLILEPLGELSLSRYFKKQHIGVSFGIYDLFHKGGLLESEIRGNNFIQHNLVERRGRTYRLRVYWRIGRFRYTKPVEITAYDM